MSKNIITFFVAVLFATMAAAQFKTITPATAEKKLNNRNVVVLDVRTIQEYKDGHLPGAIHIDVLDSVAFVNNISKLNKNKKYIVYCKSGKRSAKASNILYANKFKHIWNMDGGITAWKGKTIQ
jgi:rhodanese-related sulfurtransferase